MSKRIPADWPRALSQLLYDHPDAGGRLELRFRVKADGHATQILEVAEGESRFADIEVTRCVLGVYRTASLPAMHGATHETSFVYALHLEARPAAPISQNVSPTPK